MDFSNTTQERPQQQTIQQRQLQIILQQQQYIMKQQQQITLYQQQQRVLELEHQSQELVWEQQQLQQQPPQVSVQEQSKLLLQQQEVLYHQQEMMSKQRLELHSLQQQQQWLLLQQQLPIPQRNRHRGGPHRTTWYLDKCLSQISQNITASTINNSKDLVNIVNEHCALVHFIDNKFKELTGSQPANNSGDSIEKLRTIIKIADETSSTRNEIADNRSESHSPITEPEVIIDYIKDFEAEPEMALTATFHDTSYLSHEDISNYAQHYRVPKTDIIS